MSVISAAVPLAIVGPTASGKSSVAIELARRHLSIELLSVDSMQVYRGMDVGTAKPSPAEQAEIRHHLIDLADPHENFTLVDFQASHDAAMTGIAQRDAQPILVGGTGMYFQGVVDGMKPPPRFPEVVSELDAEPDTIALHTHLAGLDPVAAGRMEPTNRRRVLRALEVTIGSGQPFSSFGPGVDSYPDVPHRLIGIEIARPLLDERIEARYHEQIATGFLDEVEGLLARSAGWSRTAAQALGYKELASHVAGECSLDEALALANKRTRRFARRQQRWFRRDPRIEWIEHDGDASSIVEQLSPLFD
ncbi:MAG: tRNA dimethylallyltransferase [Candidatus Poriferisodalaceae bacterium]